MIHFICSFLIAVLFLSLSSDGFAARPRAQELVGEVQTVDLRSRELTVDSQCFQVTKQTRFIAENRFVEPTALKSGELVKVHYRSPLIGKKFVTKVTWPAANRPGG